MIVSDVEITGLEHAVLIERFADYPDENELLERVRATWPSAYEVRGEERLRGIGHLYVAQGLVRAVWVYYVSFRNSAPECRIAPRTRHFVPFQDFAKYTHKSSGSEKCSSVANAM